MDRKLLYRIETFGEWYGRLAISTSDGEIGTYTSDCASNFTINVECKSNERLQLELVDVQNINGFKVIISHTERATKRRV